MQRQLAPTTHPDVPIVPDQLRIRTAGSMEEPAFVCIATIRMRALIFLNSVTLPEIDVLDTLDRHDTNTRGTKLEACFDILILVTPGGNGEDLRFVFLLRRPMWRRDRGGRDAFNRDGQQRIVGVPMHHHLPQHHRASSTWGPKRDLSTIFVVFHIRIRQETRDVGTELAPRSRSCSCGTATTTT